MLATGTIYIWRGKYSLDCEVETATEIAKRYSSEIPKIVKQETTTTVADFPSDLSSLFHGNGYFKTLTSIQQPPQPQHHTHRSNPRLFSCSSGSGMVKVEEVVKYQQEDLDHNIVMILDGVEGIWVWIGFQAKTNEKVIGMETAQKYADIKYPQSSTRLNVTYSFQEPVEFTRHFHGWTKKKFPKDRVKKA